MNFQSPQKANNYSPLKKVDGDIVSAAEGTGDRME
jgi:hypothetical protein